MTLKQRLAAEIEHIRQDSLFKEERIIVGPQGAHINVAPGREVLNFCANNYLGLANHPRILAAARKALDDHGFGLASVRFICGTQDLHKQLERSIAGFLGMEDAILYSSCFDANGGLFETLLDEQDAVISDALNHASIIDGIRLCKARRYRYRHADMADLRDQLLQAKDARTRLIATDGVFSMDGDVAPLAAIVALARAHDALVMVDDSHATGFVGRRGRGSPEHCGVEGRIDILTSALGKALGGGSGGFVAAGREIVAMLRQRSRPYLFSNIASATFVASAASPSMMGTMGCIPGRMLKPSLVKPSRKNFVLASSLSRRAVDSDSSSSTLSDAATIGGATELEKRYGRDRWRSRSMISFRPLV